MVRDLPGVRLGNYNNLWQVGALASIIVSTSDSLGISNPANTLIDFTNTSSGKVGRVEVVCKVAGANAINYPANLECCVGCSGPYNLTWDNNSWSGTFTQAPLCLLLGPTRQLTEQRSGNAAGVAVWWFLAVCGCQRPCTHAQP
jgi:hypothetical protein